MEKDSIQKDYRWLHQHPELAYQEYQTTQYILSRLQEIDIPMIELGLETGAVAIINGEQKGGTIALRCDIDALPIKEESGLPYSSVHEGVMHACGHDFHTAVMLGVADELNKRKHEIKGSIKMIFQPAEEAPGGAKKIIETGVIDDVSMIWGIHTEPDLPIGAIGIREGAIMAAVDRFAIHIKGTGTHAAHPDRGNDPVVIIGSVIQSVQTIVSRNIDPLTSGLVSITHIECGNTWNAIPERGFMEGTVRTMKLSDRELIQRRMNELVEGIAKSYGAEGNVEWYFGAPAVINNRNMCELAAQVAESKARCVEEAQPALIGEDFSFYQEKCKGAFLRIGTGGDYPLHHCKFSASEEALTSTVTYLAELAIASGNGGQE